MESGHPIEDQNTVVAVGDDPETLVMLGCILRGRGYRTLFARELAALAHLLDLEIGVDTAMIRAGMPDWANMERLCLRRHVGVLFFSEIVQGSAVRLKVPEKSFHYEPRILMWEGNPDLRRLFERSLSEDGYSVTALDIGRDVLEAAEKRSFAVAVIDLSLPQSMEIIRHLHSDFPCTKILAWLEATDAALPNMASSAEVAAVIPKPRTSGELRTAIYGLLDPVRSWSNVTMSADGFRSETAGEGRNNVWGWAADRTLASLAGGDQDTSGS